MEVREPSAKYLARPAYKQTDAGVIPVDWIDYTIGDLIDFEGGSQPDKSVFRSTSKDGFIRLIQIRDYKTDKFETYVPINLARRFCTENDIMIGRYGPPIFQVLRGLSGAYNVALIKAKPRPEVTPSYCYYFLKQDALFTFIEKLSRRSSGQTGVDLQGLRGYSFPIPPIVAEQNAIAEALSDADALIESLEQLLAKKRQVKQGAMQELLTGEKRLPGFAGEWEVKRLGDSAVLKARIGWHGLTTAEYKETGDFCLVTGTEFNNGYIDWSNCFFVDESRYKQDRYIQLRLHDVLVTKDGTIGKVALVDHLPLPATLNSGVFVIRPIEDAFHPEFFYYLLCSELFANFLAQLSAGSTINHLYQKDFVEFVFSLPTSIAEQTAIATVLSDMDAELAALEAKLAKARDLKQGMMQELLTGRIRLVPPMAEVIPFPTRENAKPAIEKSHNWQINEAVIISVLAKHFGSEQWPLGRKRYTKLSYLLHRHVEHQAEGYLKKAAGPYNPATKYKGPEGIALKNGYIRQYARDQFSGFVAAEKIGEAEDYFSKWYGEDALVWLKQFRLEKNDELELLATVDMAVEDLRRAGSVVALAAVKQIIESHPEWQAKLDRPIFSDPNIERAIARCHNLFKD